MKRRIIILFFFLACTAALYSQGPQYAWVKKLSQTYSASINATLCDGAGNIYIGGNFSDSIYFDSIVLRIPGRYSFVAKYDGNGNALWAVSDTGLGICYLQGMSFDNAGNVLICGYYANDPIRFGSFALAEDSFADNSMFIATFSPANGQCLTARKIGKGIDVGNVNPGSTLSAAFTDNGGDYHVQGYATTSTDLGGQAVNGAFIARYDTGFNLIWAGPALGSPGCMDGDGNFYGVGYIEDYCIYQDSTIGSIASQRSGFTDRNSEAGGLLQWLKQEGQYYTEMVALTNNNGSVLYSEGYYKGECILDDSVVLNDSANSQGIFVYCQDYSGQGIWGKSWPVKSQPEIFSITDNLSGYVALTQFGKTDTDVSFIALLNGSGTLLGYQTLDTVYTGTTGAILNSAMDPSGNIIISGNVGNEGLITLDTFTFSTSRYPFLAKISANSLSSIVQPAPVSNTLNIFPNPNKGAFYVFCNLPHGAKNCTAVVLDITGREINRYTISSGQSSIDASRVISPGCYILNLVEDGKLLAAGKVIVAR